MEDTTNPKSLTLKWVALITIVAIVITSIITFLLTNLFDQHRYTDMTITKELTITKFVDSTNTDTSITNANEELSEVSKITLAIYKEFSKTMLGCDKSYIGKCETSRSYEANSDFTLLHFSAGDGAMGTDIEIRVLDNPDSLKSFTKTFACKKLSGNWKDCVAGTIGKQIHFKELGLGDLMSGKGKDKAGLEEMKKDVQTRIENALQNDGITY